MRQKPPLSKGPTPPVRGRWPKAKGGRAGPRSGGGILLYGIPPPPGFARRSPSLSQGRLLCSLNQLFLLCSSQPLNGGFPPEGGGFVGDLLLPDQLQGSSPPGVLGPFSRAVGGQAAGDIVGDSGVQGAVPAAEHVDKPGHRPLPLFHPIIPYYV